MQVLCKYIIPPVAIIGGVSTCVIPSILPRPLLSSTVILGSLHRQAITVKANPSFTRPLSFESNRTMHPLARRWNPPSHHNLRYRTVVPGTRVRSRTVPRYKSERCCACIVLHGTALHCTLGPTPQESYAALEC
ncbi:unnamed protein product [Tuber aestivum]|uniref:Uncharacterized protein n=1 Tax=Tuber aestivum TaxID=59557 RepID=A0A292Q5I9_9PEZI|nr:unnamed protein product [Tuber aestivum]